VFMSDRGALRLPRSGREGQRQQLGEKGGEGDGSARLCGGVKEAAMGRSR